MKPEWPRCESMVSLGLIIGLTTRCLTFPLKVIGHHLPLTYQSLGRPPPEVTSLLPFKGGQDRGVGEIKPCLVVMGSDCGFRFRGFHKSHVSFKKWICFCKIWRTFNEDTKI